ncbi:MAG TPA: hypothetical protein V6C63_21170 [Allocoleopsis sp.]
MQVSKGLHRLLQRWMWRSPGASGPPFFLTLVAAMVAIAIA